MGRKSGGILDREGRSAAEARHGKDGLAPSPSHAFIGYSREDYSFASSLRDDLEAAGITTWFDARNIEAGAHWQEEIQTALEGAFASLICIGPSKVGGYLKQEIAMSIDLASEDRLRVIPVILPGVEDSQIPLRLRSPFHYMDFRQDRAAVLKSLIETLLRLGSPGSR